MDELLLNDAIKFDDRNFIHFLCRVIKKKKFFGYFLFVIILVFEPLSFKLICFILLCSNFFFLMLISLKENILCIDFIYLKKLILNNLLNMKY